MHDPHLVVTPVSTVGAMNLPGEAGDLAWAAAEPLGAVGDRVVDQLADEVELVVGDHRPDLGVPVERVADLEALGLADDAGDEVVGDLALDVDALDPRAGLAGVGEAAPDGARDRVGELGVGADDHRVLAAELEHRALEFGRRPRRPCGRPRPSR